MEEKDPDEVLVEPQRFTFALTELALNGMSAMRNTFAQEVEINLHTRPVEEYYNIIFSTSPRATDPAETKLDKGPVACPMAVE